MEAGICFLSEIYEIYCYTYKVNLKFWLGLGNNNTCLSLETDGFGLNYLILFQGCTVITFMKT